MIDRRQFISALAVTLVPLGLPNVEGQRVENLRDIETVRADELLSAGVKEVFLNGKRYEHVTAFNKREGWIDTVAYNEKYPAYDRRYGVVTYTMEKLYAGE